ncbi:MAG: hypothetical protein JWR80_9917 [Bradyrhizobium sp.]|nr:hypothetical protein [Bradyrhizobium sp.]
MAIILMAFWVGSAVAGWFLFWPWLLVPIAVIALHIARVSGRMRAMRERNGLPATGHGTSMAGANIQLLLTTLIQHAAIFGSAAVAHLLIA